MEKGFEVEPWLAAVEDANWQMVGEMVARTPEDRTMLGWAAANLLSKNLNFRTAAAMVYEKTSGELPAEAVNKLEAAMTMEPESSESLRARYQAAAALVVHEEFSPTAEATIEKASGCDDDELSGLATECLDDLEKIKQSMKKRS